ncbi:DNA helicase homolog [Striga asiatica]|uniref:ATP-dependent DNA helicase n=1 Tax=Striga asiatica TaxID=4170 RepID=A0A5A7R781_STRAF|nr:DNA helicase homolog [Striga asiatica]
MSEDFSRDPSLSPTQIRTQVLAQIACFLESMGAFFIDSPGGTGKSFLYRALLADIRSKGYIGLATATSGIAASILPGDFAGKEVFIHRIPLEPPSDQQYPVPYVRTQFPVRLSFAMTINKAQGQTLDSVSIYLKEPVFSHGQLYVALSRARLSSNVTVLIKPPYFDKKKGTIVSATVYGSAQIQFWDERIIQYKRYYVSGATVQQANPLYQISDYGFTWTIQKGTLIEEYPEKLPPQLPCKIHLQEYSKLSMFAETKTLQNVMGVVVHVLPQKDASSTSNTKNLVIVNAVNRPMIFTLWGEFAKEEGQQLASTLATGNIIVATRVRVTTFNLLSLTTTHLSTIMINPPMAESVSLKQWYIDHKEEVNHQLELKVYENPEFLLPPPNESQIISVHSALKNLQTAVLAFGQTSYWFTACHNCKKGLRAQIGWIVTCPHCKAEGPVEPRSRFTLGIEDNTGLIQAVISGPEADQLLPMTAAQMSLNKNQTGYDPHRVNHKSTKTHKRQYKDPHRVIPECRAPTGTVPASDDRSTLGRRFQARENTTEIAQMPIHPHTHPARLTPLAEPRVPRRLTPLAEIGEGGGGSEQLTPTAHKVLASILNTPSPITLDKQNKQGAKRSINFDLQTNEPTDADQVEADHPEGPTLRFGRPITA